MTNQHPITPPPELITDWCKQRACISEPGPIHVWLATEAARWGADQQLKLDAEQIAQAYQKGADMELEACCNYFEDRLRDGIAKDLRIARRPKPPSLKELALEALKVIECEYVIGSTTGTIRKALEALPND